MAYDERLALRIQKCFDTFPEEVRENLVSKKMFGGLAFLFHGKMTVGVVKEDLMVRVVGDKMPEVLNRAHVRPMDFTNRPMKEFIFVSVAGFETELQLLEWIELGLEHARTKL